MVHLASTPLAAGLSVRMHIRVYCHRGWPPSMGFVRNSCVCAIVSSTCSRRVVIPALIDLVARRHPVAESRSILIPQSSPLDPSAWWLCLRGFPTLRTLNQAVHREAVVRSLVNKVPNFASQLNPRSSHHERLVLTNDYIQTSWDVRTSKRFNALCTCSCKKAEAPWRGPEGETMLGLTLIPSEHH